MKKKGLLIALVLLGSLINVLPLVPGAHAASFVQGTFAHSQCAGSCASVITLHHTTAGHLIAVGISVISNGSRFGFPCPSISMSDNFSNVYLTAINHCGVIKQDNANTTTIYTAFVKHIIAPSSHGIQFTFSWPCNGFPTYCYFIDVAYEVSGINDTVASTSYNSDPGGGPTSLGAAHPLTWTGSNAFVMSVVGCNFGCNFAGEEAGYFCLNFACAAAYGYSTFATDATVSSPTTAYSNVECQCGGVFVAFASPGPSLAPSGLYGCTLGADYTSYPYPESSLYHINTTTGTATLIGAMGMFGCQGLAFNAAGQLYAVGQATENGTENLFTVDIDTGAATSVGIINNTIRAHPCCPYLNVMQGISFSPVDGKLYAVNTDNSCNNPSNLWTLDTDNAAATKIGRITVPCLDTATFSPNGTLYLSTGISNGTSGIIPLSTIDPSTAASNILFYSDLNAVCSTDNVMGMAFNDSNRIFVSVECYGSSHLAIWNITSQTFTDVGASINTLSGLAFAPLGTFQCSITNMDAKNNVIGGNGKFYDFHCKVSSNEITLSPNSVFDYVELIFNDSLTRVTLATDTIFTPTHYYGNSSIQPSDSGTNAKMLVGVVNVATLNASGVYTSTLDFNLQFSSSVQSAINRGIVMQACVKEDGGRGTEVCLFKHVQENYFNFLVNGGRTILSTGSCAVPAGADTLGMECNYNGTASSNIEENATYFKFQQYQGLFSFQLADAGCSASAPNFCTEGDPRLWQTYPFSGGGSQNNTAAGAWDVIVGLYYWDNSSQVCCWVRGLNAELSTGLGRVGANYQFTQYNVEWRNGETFIANQTFYTYTEPAPAGRSTIYVNLWYSQNNGSTSQGGRVAAYYTGMVKSSLIPFFPFVDSTWGPQNGNDTSAQIFAPLLNHDGNLMGAQVIDITKVFMIMSRPIAPAPDLGQPNFTILSYNFQLDQFLTTQGEMTGIDTPSFTGAIVPQIAGQSIFSPIIKALQSLAALIASTLLAVGTILWNGLGNRFPWFTGTLASFTNLIISFWKFAAYTLIYVGDFIRFAYSIIGLVLYPINAIISAWATIQSIYLPIFKGANLNAILILAVLWVFSGYVIESAEKGDTGAFIALATGAWRIVNTIADWTWKIAKFFVDAVEGLIP